MNRLLCILVCVFSVSAFAERVPQRTLLQFDANADGQLDEAELQAYFRSVDADDPADAAGDVLTAFPNDGGKISIARAAMVVEPQKETPPTATAAPCKWFGIKRTVADAPNPRAPESEFPAIFSYSRNEHAEDRDQLNALGAVTAADCIWNPFGGDLNHSIGITPGVDFEVDGASAANASTIKGSVPFFWRWAASRNAFLSGWNVTLTPSFATDRAFDRETWEIAAKFNVRSRSLLRMGFVSSLKDTNADPTVSIWWQPTLQFETGEVLDAAGNEDLEALRGSYSRFAPRLDVIVWPRALSDRITLKANLTRRTNVNGQARSYFESSAVWDLTASGSVGLTAVYRHGRKPPDFGARDQWLIGIGIQR